MSGPPAIDENDRDRACPARPSTACVVVAPTPATMTDPDTMDNTVSEQQTAPLVKTTKATRRLRRGKWIQEEEAYSARLIQEFVEGVLPLTTDGTTMRAFLSQMLLCDPMRITKKLADCDSIGKHKFQLRCDHTNTDEQLEQRRAELWELERRFHARINRDDDLAGERHHSRVRPRRMTSHVTQHQIDLSVGRQGPKQQQQQQQPLQFRLQPPIPPAQLSHRKQPPQQQQQHHHQHFHSLPQQSLQHGQPSPYNFPLMNGHQLPTQQQRPQSPIRHVMPYGANRHQQQDSTEQAALTLSLAGLDGYDHSGRQQMVAQNQSGQVQHSAYWQQQNFGVHYSQRASTASSTERGTFEQTTRPLWWPVRGWYQKAAETPVTPFAGEPPSNIATGLSFPMATAAADHRGLLMMHSDDNTRSVNGYTAAPTPAVAPCCGCKQNHQSMASMMLHHHTNSTHNNDNVVMPLPPRPVFLRDRSDSIASMDSADFMKTLLSNDDDDDDDDDVVSGGAQLHHRSIINTSSSRLDHRNVASFDPAPMDDDKDDHDDDDDDDDDDMDSINVSSLGDTDFV